MAAGKISLYVAIIIVSTVAGYFIAEGVTEKLDDYDLDAWTMIGVGIIIALAALTLVHRHSARLTVPLIVGVALACLALGYLT